MLQSYTNMFGLICDIARMLDENGSTLETSNLWGTNFHRVLNEVISAEDINLSTSQTQKLTRIEHMFFDYVDIFKKYAVKPSIKTVVESIFTRAQVEQRSQQWYEDMKIMLTASEFATLYKSSRSIGQLALSKLNPEKRVSQKAVHSMYTYPTDWGVRFEPVVRTYLENLWNCTIYECGRLRHPTNTKIGASPDGIIINTQSEKYGRLVEIKCPFSRPIGKGVPKDYWVQMQIQLEVTDLEECEYVEVQIVSKTPKVSNPTFPTSVLVKGEVYLLEKDNQFIYAYTAEEKEKCINDSYDLVEVVEYAIAELYNVVVKRDRSWYKSTEILQTEFWNTVAKAKDGDYILPDARAAKPKTCLISEE